MISTKAPLSSTAFFFLLQSIVAYQVTVAGLNQDQNEEEGVGAVYAGVAESVESVSDRQE